MILMNPEQFLAFRKSNRFNENLYQLGRVAEIEVFNKLKEYFKDDSIIPRPEGDSFDFQGMNSFFELKSRRNFKNTYHDTAIGIKKIEKALADQNNDYYFVFKYIDGLFYVKMNSTVKLRKGLINNIPHYFIPVSILNKIQ